MQTAAPAADAPRPLIKVRKMDLRFADAMPERWFDDNAMLTATLSALAVSFPAGERFFIASVRHFLPKITDPSLREAVHAFIGQEAHHTKEHVAFNRFLAEKGLPVERMERFLTAGITRLQRTSTPEANLARTAALEHFTAILAGSLLEHPEALDMMPDEVAKLWAWHAIEEIEHRSVAFDVYQSCVGDEALRRRMMAVVTVMFLTMNTLRSGVLFRAMGGLREPRAALKALDLMWGRPGVFRKVIPQYREYFREGFHPSQHDYGPAVERAKERYLGDKA